MFFLSPGRRWPRFTKMFPSLCLSLINRRCLARPRVGTALGGSFTVDLLNLPEPARMSTSANDNRHLDIRGQGMKSVDEPFYRVDTGLRYSAKQSGRILQEFSLLADYNGVKEPLGEDQHTRHAGIGGVGVMLKLAPKTRLSLDARYRWTQDKLDANLPALSTRTVANEQANRLLFEAIPPRIDGFLRAALWGDNGWLTKAEVPISGWPGDSATPRKSR